MGEVREKIQTEICAFPIETFWLGIFPINLMDFPGKKAALWFLFFFLLVKKK